jgi:hypothetical protein
MKSLPRLELSEDHNKKNDFIIYRHSFKKNKNTNKTNKTNKIERKNKKKHKTYKTYKTRKSKTHKKGFFHLF